MAKAIMIQGTMSNVGKSLLTAGLCRVFQQDGYKVTPFKSQNMALNSGITADGLEMGRAQMMQAEACGIAPDVRMNPILLKPVTDVGSQVIVNGKVLGNMKAAEYFRYKQKLIPDIMKAYQSLAEEYDIIVLEGAGSPAEINLKQDDIVNMNMAKWAGAPVLLVGDIDRGGVFAQLVGTMLLLEPEEQQIVKGLVINKFRGDVSILEPGLRQLEEKANVPVVGVMPYVYVDIDEEDSLSTRLEQQKKTASLDVAVIRLPRISNFTDFMALETEPDVQLRYVTAVQELKQPDMIILPGTKNTISDLLWLRESGLEAAIKQQASRGCLIFGICGGYQMLGQTLRDPLALEGGGTTVGLGLLPVETVFQPEKQRRQISGVLLPCGLQQEAGIPVNGYEIHMGNTILHDGAQPFLQLEFHQDGCWQDRVYGTYLHGIFDSDAFRQQLLRMLYQKKGIQPEQHNRLSWQAYREQQYDKLADAVRENLDLSVIYQILEEGL